MLMLTGCGKSYKQAQSGTSNKEYGNGYFTLISEWEYFTEDYKIVYANDTKVKYLIISGTEKKSGITPLLNADGTPQLYEDESAKQ